MPVRGFTRQPFRLRGSVAGGRSRGFTIIELMLVIAVLSVLTTIAIFAYADYTKRTRMIEVLLAAGACKNSVVEAYYFGAPPAEGAWGCESATPTTDHVDSIDVDENGKVVVIARGFGDDDIDGKALTFTPLINGAPAVLSGPSAKALQWRCGSVTDGTTIAPQFLPSTCRNP